MSLTPEMRHTFVFNAPTFLNELTEAESVMSIDDAQVAAFTTPTRWLRRVRTSGPIG